MNVFTSGRLIKKDRVDDEAKDSVCGIISQEGHVPVSRSTNQGVDLDSCCLRKGFLRDGSTAWCFLKQLEFKQCTYSNKFCHLVFDIRTPLHE
jgi:hypothetical protein